MTPAAGALVAQQMSVRQRLTDYLALTKPRVVLMVLITTFVGYYLGSRNALDALPLLHTLIGTALAAGGTMALNQFMERARDSQMVRTRHRPLPEGRLLPVEALVFGSALMALGLAYLLWTVGPLAAGLTTTISATYLVLYTPLKTVTPLCSLVGAVPGALPPVVGWAAARGDVGFEAWLLFAIMFLWQVPAHARDRRPLPRRTTRAPASASCPSSTGAARARARTPSRTAWRSFPSLSFRRSSAWPARSTSSSRFCLSGGLLWTAIALRRSGSLADARRLMMASLLYLPLLLAVMAIDKLPLP
jgi:protoheme IX farnesyltransferase